MTSTNIKKYSYINESNTPISLIEYYIESDESNKYLIFNFCNNFNQTLKWMEVLIEGYDSNNKLVQSITFRHYETIQSNKLFMPNNKLLVKLTLETIKFRIIKAEYESSLYVDGVFSELNKKIELSEDVKAIEEEYVKETKPLENVTITKINDKKTKHEKQLDKYQKKAEHNYYKKQIKSKDKQCFKVQSLIKQNFKAWKIVLPVILLAISIAGLIWSTAYFTNSFGEFVEIDNVTYQVLSDKAYVYEGNKKETDVTIEENIVYNDTLYQVVGIRKNAYKNAKVKKLTLTRSVTLGNNAFEGSDLEEILNPEYITQAGEYAFKSTKLTSISFENLKTVKKGTFENIKTLTVVNVLNATVESSAFKGSNNISNITVNKTKSYNFIDIFGTNSYGSIMTVYIKSAIDQNYSFKGINSISYLYINSSSTYHKEDNVMYVNWN